MSVLNTTSGGRFTSSVLIGDPITQAITNSLNGSTDSTPDFTKVGGNYVSACLELQSRLGALLVPRMTGDERDDLLVTQGMIILNEDTNTFNLYQGNPGAWEGIPGVITPTIANDIAIFADTAGTLQDSTIRLLASTGASNLFIGDGAGSIDLRADASLTTLYGTDILSDAADLARVTAIGDNIGALATGNLLDCVFVGHGIANTNAIVNLTQITATGSLCFEGIQSTSSESCGYGYGVMAAATTIVQSVALGNRVGISNASYTNCTLVGYNADTNGVHVGATAIGHGTIVNGANSTAIGIGAVANADNALILGATDTKVGVNTSNPAAYFDNKGSAGVKVTDVTAFPYVIAIDDCYINCRPGDGNTSSVTLPLIALNVNIGRMFVITCIDTAGININTSGGQSFGPDAPLVTRAVPGVPHTLTVVACQEGVGDFIWRTYAQ